MADYHMEGLVREINFEAAKLAKKVRGPALFAAQSVALQQPAAAAFTSSCCTL